MLLFEAISGYNYIAGWKTGVYGQNDNTSSKPSGNLLQFPAASLNNGVLVERIHVGLPRNLSISDSTLYTLGIRENTVIQLHQLQG